MGTGLEGRMRKETRKGHIDVRLGRRCNGIGVSWGRFGKRRAAGLASLGQIL
jgi:hypothetical protein